MSIKYSFLSGTKKVKKTIASSLLLLLFINNQAIQATTYYSNGSNAPNLTSSWKPNTNGTGTSPTNFTVASDVFIVQNGHTMTTTANWAVTGSVQVSNGGTLTLSAYTVTISAGTTVSGTLNITSTTGTKTFVGLVTINSGGNWNNTANEAITFRGGINCYGGGNAGTGVQTFNTNNQSINGSLVMPRMTITGVTVTNNGTLDITTVLTGTGALTQGDNSILNIGGTSTITTLNATNTGNTVIYNSTGNQTAHVNSYYNLTLSTGGTKTITGISTINGTLTIDNATVTPSTGLTIGGDIILNNNFSFTTGAFTHTISGNWTQNGWGNVTATAGSTINFTGNNSAINGTNTNSNTVNFYNIAVSKNTDAILSVTGSYSSINVANDFTINTGTFSNGSTQLKIAGSWINNNGYLTAGDGYVSMIGDTKTVGGSTPTTFRNLEIGNGSSNYTTTLGNSQTVLGTLKMSNGLLKLGSNNITLGSTANISGSMFSGNMVITDGTGEVRKVFSDNGSFTFPIGETTNYTPATLNLTEGSYVADAYIGMRVINAKEPNNLSTDNYITRYWSVSQSGISQSKYDFTGTSIFSGDNVGQRANSLTAIDNNGTWTTFGVPAGDTFTVSNISTYGNITTVNNSPVINTSTPSLSGFGYALGAGPSSQQSLTVSGYAVSTNIVITAPSNYEISTTSGSGFTNSITLNSSATNVPATTIYVRLKSGLAINTYTQNINITSGSASKTVSVTGVVYPTPCPYAGNTSSGITTTPIINMGSYVNTVSTNFSTNTYFILNVIKGLTYQIYTCNTPSSPLKMSVYEEGNASNFIISSISNTGNTCNTNANNVFLSFTSPISGQVRILLNAQSSCTATAITGLTVNVNVPSGVNTQDDTNMAGNNTWIGHMYDGTAVFNNYIGYYNTTAYGGKTDEFQEQFATGGTFPNADNNDVASFNINSNGVVRAKILDATFTTRYKMNSTKRGFWTFTVVADDGVRLTVDGTLQYSHWNDQSPTTNTNMLMSLTGNSSLVLDYYENGGQNVMGFYSLAQIMPNELTVNATQTICLGNVSGGLPISGDAFPVLPTGLSANGYTWSYSTSLNGPRTIISGATGATYTPSGTYPFNLPGTYYIFRNATINSTYSSTGAPVQNGNPFNANQTNESNAAVVVIKACNNFWIGTTSTNWGTNTNWKTGYVPATGDDVIFATEANNSGVAAINDLQLDADRTIGNLINSTNKKLIIPPYKSLIVDGTVTTLENDPTLILIKASATAPNGTLIFRQPLQNTNVSATVEMYAKGYFGSAVQWTDDFDPSQIGAVHTNYYRWQYFGIPIQSIQAQPTFEGSWIREYNESKNINGFYQKWTDLVNESILTPFKGYELTQDVQKTITYQGNLVVGDKTLTLTVSGGYGSGYNIFSNSYTAAIDISKMQFGSGVEKTVYLYNTGTFSDWGKGNLAGSYTAIPYNTSSIIGNEIPSMQGFMLKASTNNSNVTIPYNATISSATKNMTQQRVKRENASENQSTESIQFNDNKNLSFLKIEVSSDSAYDCTWIFDSENTSHDFDNGWDGSKLIGAQGMCIYSDEEIGSLQVNTLNNVNNVYLGFRSGNDTQYTMTIQAENIIAKYQELYLKDLINGTNIKLDKSVTTYHFIANKANELGRRFVITGTRKEIEKINPLKITNKQNKFIVSNNGDENGILYLYDVIGKKTLSSNLTSQATIELPNNLPQGAYIINFVTENNNSFSKKLIVK